jgi:hypothetical protein
VARRLREPSAGSARGTLAQLLHRCLEDGCAVEIERLGFFRPNGEGGFEFTPNQKPGIFIAYVEEDRAAAERLYNVLARAGLDPWMDKKKLQPGQNWPRAIERAISVSDFFIACLSRRSLVKRGAFQSEMRWALDCAHQTPLGDIFFIPVRLEDCAVPSQILQSTHCLDLFPDWKAGVERLVSAIRAEYERRGDRQVNP